MKKNTKRLALLLSILLAVTIGYFGLEGETGDLQGRLSTDQVALVGPTQTQKLTTDNVCKSASAKKDADSDGLSDKKECKIGTNPNKPDTDGDGLADSIEHLNKDAWTKSDPLKKDTDGDGVNDQDETGKYRIQYQAGDDGNWLSPNLADTDGDGIKDGDEILIHGTDPVRKDGDKDGLLDGDEINFGTDPYKKDTDGDGLHDGVEINGTFTDPRDQDSDNDGLSDSQEHLNGTDGNNKDTDGDGWLDGEEIEYKTDPLDPESNATVQ